MIRRGHASSCLGDLAKAFVHPARDGRGEIQTARTLRRDHGKCDSVVDSKGRSDPLVDLRRNSALFLTEKQVVTLLKVSIPVRSTRLGGEEPESLRLFAGKIRLPRSVLAAVDMLPVI